MGPSKARAWYVISLRPQGQHAALRRAAAQVNAGVIALSPWALVARQDTGVDRALQQALKAQVVMFTSPAAVRFAVAQHRLVERAGQHWIGTGTGTCNALRRAGISQAIAPSRMDSEGLLSLPALAELSGRSVGLVTAPDGRGMLAPALAARGAQVLLAEIYQRQPLALSAMAIRRLATLDKPACVAMTSSGALQRVLEQLPPQLCHRLRQCLAVSASPRLATLAQDAGFLQVVQADGPRPAQLMAAASAWFSHHIR